MNRKYTVHALLLSSPRRGRLSQFAKLFSSSFCLGLGLRVTRRCFYGTAMTTTVVGSQVETQEEKPVDREKSCPLLLRVFCANGRHNALSEYGRGSVPPNELQIYTWMDCSLRELMTLIKEVNPDARRRGTLFEFAIVGPDRFSPRYAMREIGNTCNGQRGVDDSKTLSQCKFEIGDFIDVAITIPGMPGPGMGGRRGGGGGGDYHGGGGGGGYGRDGGGPPFRGGGRMDRY